MKRPFFSLLILFGVFVVMAAPAEAQQSSETASQGAQPAAARSQADETFDLNITERRRIVGQNYRASTSVEIGPDQTRGVWLRVGVGVFASNIEGFLRNVTGHVRFRASLDPVLKRINLRRSNLTTR